MQLTLGFIESPSIFFFTEGRKSLDGSKGPPALSCSVHHSAHCSMCLLLHQQVHSQKSNARKSFSTPPSIASHHISMETIWCGLMGRLSCNSLRQKVDSTFLRTSEIAIFFFFHCLSSKVWVLSLLVLQTHIVDSPEPKSCCVIFLNAKENENSHKAAFVHVYLWQFKLSAYKKI